MLQFTPLRNKLRITARKYYVADITNKISEGQLGLIMPIDMVVIDIDSTDERSKYYIDFIKEKFKGIFITKSLKAGGYHMFFKTDRLVKRQIGLQSVFGWKFDILKGKDNYIVLPDNYEGREYLTRFTSYQDLAHGWDAYDVMLPDNLDDVMPYLDCEIDHPNILSLKDGERNAGVLEWLGFFCAKGVPYDKIAEYTPVLAKISGLPERELQQTVMSSLSKYTGSNKESRDSTGREPIKRFVGEDYVDLSMKLKDFLITTKMFGFDEATGLGYCNTPEKLDNGLSVKELKQKMILYLGDKLFIANKDGDGRIKSTSRVPVADRDALFEEIKECVRFNSRVDIYRNIPKWDGIERINTFLSTYYACDTNPNLFWLFMTTLVGMIANPAKTYCPYWFDFVSQEKGVGKTLLLKKLSHGFFVFMSKGRSTDDMYVNAYSENAIIMVDDECAQSDPEHGNGISYDLWKQFVTSDKDTFSRKNQQPETHPRSFIVCRTSNKVKTGYAVNERRQIIFESRLGQNECKILDLPDSFFDQLMAEAKVYYENHDHQPYKLTEEDKETIRIQQMLYFDTERDAYTSVKDYINSVRVKLNSPSPDYECEGWFVKTKFASTGYALTWNTYRKWVATKTGNRVYASQTFWSCVDAIATRTGLVTKKQPMPVSIDGGEPQYYCTLYVNDADVITPDMNQKQVDCVSVMGFFEPEKDFKKSITTQEIEKELKTNPLSADKITDGYILPDEVRYLPASARMFFEKYKNDTHDMIPTPVDIAPGINITYGLGGAHFAKKAYTATDIIHVDVNSMYPNIMIQYNLLSRAITSPDVFVDWVHKRLEAKKNDDVATADNLKLKINSVYGLMKSKNSTLYDPYYASSIAIRGQVLITILTMGLANVGCEIINVNTDGIFFKPAGDYKTICSKWEERTKLTLSYKKYALIEQADVNNYRLVDLENNIITKGAKFNKK